MFWQKVIFIIALTSDKMTELSTFVGEKSQPGPHIVKNNNY